MMKKLHDHHSNNMMQINFNFDESITTFFLSKKVIIIVSFMAMITVCTNAHAQKGALRGGSVVLNNGTHSITLAAPTSGLTNYGLIFPAAQSAASTIQWLSNNGAGVLSWVTAPSGFNALAVGFATGFPQETATSPNYLFDLQSLKPASGGTTLNSTTPGAFINSTVNGANADATGLTINVTNTLAGATGITMTGISMHSGTLAAPGTYNSNNYGLSVNVSGGGTNYAALFTSGNVGFGTTAPTESLEVNGNIRISGKNGLKITEGTNATMGIATLAGGTIVVNTAAVTANSRIFLMDQATNGGTPGTVYVNGRTAGTSFTINSTNAGDVSDVAWILIEP